MTDYSVEYTKKFQNSFREDIKEWSEKYFFLTRKSQNLFVQFINLSN
ncbi:Addiction module toxin RelE (fragment) [Carnobacterium maltaromaticum]